MDRVEGARSRDSRAAHMTLAELVRDHYLPTYAPAAGNTLKYLAHSSILAKRSIIRASSRWPESTAAFAISPQHRYQLRMWIRQHHAEDWAWLGRQRATEHRLRARPRLP